MSETGWLRRRAALNHDWLKNQYLPAVWNFCRVLGGQVRSPDVLARFPRQTLPQWEQRRGELELLLDDFDRMMSPRILLGQKQFASLDPGVRKWMGDVVDALWRVRYPVARWVLDAQRSYREMDAMYNSLKHALEPLAEPSPAARPQTLRTAVEFRKACSALTRCIEILPHRVEIL